MAFEFDNNNKDASLIINRALPTPDGTATSSDFDLKAVNAGPTAKYFDLEVSVPLLTATNLPSADTLTITVQGGAAATPSTTLNIVKVITGTGSDIAAQVLRFRLPAGCPRYVNVKFVAAGGTGDMSAKSATIALVF